MSVAHTTKCSSGTMHNHPCDDLCDGFDLLRRELAALLRRATNAGLFQTLPSDPTMPSTFVIQNG